MGWNDFGGWRVGIRDTHNTYHYFAHLAYFNKDIKEGDIVEPRTIIGSVGSSGYGKRGHLVDFLPISTTGCTNIMDGQNGLSIHFLRSEFGNERQTEVKKCKASVIIPMLSAFSICFSIK